MVHRSVWKDNPRALAIYRIIFPIKDLTRYSISHAKVLVSMDRAIRKEICFHYSFYMFSLMQCVVI